MIFIHRSHLSGYHGIGRYLQRVDVVIGLAVCILVAGVFWLMQDDANGNAPPGVENIWQVVSVVETPVTNTYKGRETCTSWDYTATCVAGDSRRVVFVANDQTSRLEMATLPLREGDRFRFVVATTENSIRLPCEEIELVSIADNRLSAH